MKKKQLKALKILNATEKMMEVVKSDKGYDLKGYYQKDIHLPLYHWFMRARKEKIDNQEILQVFLYTREEMLEGKTESKYIIYLSKEESAYITYEPALDKWRTATIDHLEYGTSIPWGATIRFWCEEREEQLICDYTDNEYKVPYTSIGFFECNTKRQKELDYIDHYMNQVPELPKNFEIWANDGAMIKSRYILYQYSRAVKEGYCTHCGQTVEIKNPKYNQEGKCPNCKSMVIFKSINKAGHIVDWGAGSIIQKTKEGYVIRYFDIKKDYEDYKNPKLHYWEGIRTVYDERWNQVHVFEFAKFHGTNIIRWCKKDYSNWNEKVVEKYSVLYTRNLKQVLKGSRLQYSAWDVFLKNNPGFKSYPRTFIGAYISYPCMEFLVKVKLNNMVKQILQSDKSSYMDLHEKNPKQVFKLSKEEIKLLCKMDATMEQYDVIVEAKEMGNRLTEEQIKFFARECQRDNFQMYVRYTTPYRIIRYIKAQMEKKEFETSAYGGIVRNSFIGDYHDYLGMASRVGYDLNNEFVLFPRHFKQAHDEVTEEENMRIEERKCKEERPDNSIIQKQKKELEKLYVIESEDLFIRMPDSATEIRQEGQQLHHCVGSYVSNVVKGKTTILFIRKKEEPDKPYYTMEVKENEIIQVRGLNNNDPLEDVNKLVDKFQKERLEMRKTKERKVS